MSSGQRAAVSPFRQPRGVWAVAFACVVSFACVVWFACVV